jgi:hypothetical protein
VVDEPEEDMRNDVNEESNTLGSETENAKLYLPLSEFKTKL